MSTSRAERMSTAPTKPTGESSVVMETVQDAIYRTIHHTDGHPPKAIAEEIRLPLSVLYDIADEHRERHLRAEEIPALVKATNNFAVLDLIEARVGRVAFRVPPQVLTLDAESALAVDAIREFSETLDSYTTAVRDGRMTQVEARGVARQADEAIAAIARIKVSAANSAREVTKTGRAR